MYVHIEIILGDVKIKIIRSQKGQVFSQTDFFFLETSVTLEGMMDIG